MVSCSPLVHIMNTLGWCEVGRINIDSVALPVLLLPLPCRPAESNHRIKKFTTLGMTCNRHSSIRHFWRMRSSDKKGWGPLACWQMTRDEICYGHIFATLGHHTLGWFSLLRAWQCVPRWKESLTLSPFTPPTLLAVNIKLKSLLCKRICLSSLSLSLSLTLSGDDDKAGSGGKEVCSPLGKRFGKKHKTFPQKTVLWTFYLHASPRNIAAAGKSHVVRCGRLTHGAGLKELSWCWRRSKATPLSNTRL